MKATRYILVGLYLLIPVAFISLNLLQRQTQPEPVRWPALNFVRRASAEITRWWPKGIPQLDVAATRRAVSRLPSTVFLRQVGNSLRIACGQDLSWVVWGGREPEMLFPDAELWLSEGLQTENNRHIVDGAAHTIEKYNTLLQAEGWTLLVVPVPTKLTIHRDHCDWPLAGKDPLTRHPIAEDRADEAIDALFARMQEAKVAAVDLRTIYRDYLKAHPDAWLYPPGESHWSGVGLRLAAEATAERIAQITNTSFRKENPTFLDVEEVADMARTYDPYPHWLGRLRPLYTYKDRLVNGHSDRPYDWSVTRGKCLVVVAGTSYTGQYTWHFGQPVGYSWHMGGLLEECEVHGRPSTGLGSFHAFRVFLNERQAHLDGFKQRRQFDPKSKVVVWEFPIRDLAVLLDQ